MPGNDVLRVGDIALADVQALLARYALSLQITRDGKPIEGSFWGEPEAGVVGKTIHARSDTPVHSLLHETCHVICMSDDRRKDLHKDAGGDDLEEAAVCYLQVLLADELPGVGRQRLMQDMDTWGYSFRLGSTAAWFDEDAEDAREWLISHGVLGSKGEVNFRLRP
ncbi:MAG: hypothetical protein R3358_03475 [Woeseiaceae bacterium]|nr:hypothetical protein [Woeseiaceae bacterium]